MDAASQARPARASLPRWRCRLLVLSGCLAFAVAACGGEKAPTSAGPIVAIEEPGSPSVQLPLRLAGWGLDPGAVSDPGVKRIDVLDGGCDAASLGYVTYGILRQDVARQYGDQFTRTGWEFSRDHLAAGEHTLAVRLESTRGETICDSVSLTIEARPIISVETDIASTVLLPYNMSGWGIDLASHDGAGVMAIEVRSGGCDGSMLGEATHGMARPDIGQRYGKQFTDAGWQFAVDRLSVGRHILGVRLISENEGASACETVSLTVE